MSDLKSCPFCGFTDVEPYRSGEANHYVECPRCGTFGPDCDSRQEAIVQPNYAKLVKIEVKQWE